MTAVRRLLARLRRQPAPPSTPMARPVVRQLTLDLHVPAGTGQLELDLDAA